MHVIPIGVDTETKRGKPITFQFYAQDNAIPTRIIWIKNPKTASKEFFAYLDSLPATRDRHYVLFGHNLSFDLISLLYDRFHVLRDEKIEGTWHGWRVEIVYAAVRFAKFRKGHKVVTLIDTLAYFVKKLEELAELVCPELPKLKMPEGLGQKDFSPRDKEFCEYAMRDSLIAYRVGLVILEMHKAYDVSLAVSAPHFASKVFRKHFLKKIIPLPPRKIVYAALSAYHGGKNNITVSQGIYKSTYSLDIKSAYPFAMAQFPSFSDSTLYRALSGKGTPRELPPFGIYKISGSTKECKWPVLYNHSFQPIQGEFSNVWVTGFELNEALRMKEVKLTSTYGYYYDADLDLEPSPFKAYVEEFFSKKELATSKIHREFNKLLLNALYGKFIQTRHLSGISDLTFDIDDNKLLADSALLAGGLFNPFIACLITGHTRAYIHRLEHKYQALHTSTDGIKSQIKPKKNDLAPKSLGGLSAEAGVEEKVDTLILRNKLYIDYAPLTKADKKNPKVLRSQVFKGKKIFKYALHGFHGSVQVLEKLWHTGEREYEYVKVNKLRESLRRNLQVNDFVTRPGTLHLPGEEQ